MPIDDYGNRADIILDGISVFNRMNPGQVYEQFITAGAEQVRKQMVQMCEADTTNGWKQAYSWMMEYLTDCNPNWAKLVDDNHPTDELKQQLVAETLEKGMYIQMSPFQKGFNQNNILPMKEKYNIKKTCVNFGVKLPDGSFKQVRSKHPVLIGEEYWFCLCKIPHMRSSGIGYVNQYHTAAKPGTYLKLQYPFAQTALRIGEDEVRNLSLTSGAENAARILGMYGNSPDATDKLGEYLISANKPSSLKQLDMSTDDIVDTNVMSSIVKHCFSCIGIDITSTVNDLTPDQKRYLIKDSRTMDNLVDDSVD